MTPRKLRAEKREKMRAKKKRMKVSGKSVIALQKTIGEQARKIVIDKKKEG